ncbi:Na+/H+ antiporter NhaC family protein [Anaerosalibacter sp. Marseille-P3206]|uniref:Na+/H+ antiporter NhaC family protein n=1 Tax=Anaerosalibacter sp. Marseille-P3206 TaxID=1871005 RepID=UPI000987B0BC|nr:Na+/H+ antiporter NhaC family protein [Anaerosalibacter sp. Marseille-P3206]
MDILIGLVVSSIMLIYSVVKDVFIGIPLTLCLFIFCTIAHRRDYPFKEIFKIAYKGGEKSFIVGKILLLIGMVTASWMASGTVEGMVFYGIKFMNPSFFIVYTYIICTLVSYIMGTAFGTVGTIGLSLMCIARIGNLNPNIVAGAIVSGAYFGDRCSPMSSSANLIANLTDTDIYTNIKNMIKTTIVPVLLCILIYFLFSLKYPLNLVEKGINEEILKYYKISIIVLLPAILILVLSIFKIDVKKSMLLSIILAFIISCFYQGVGIKDFLYYLVFGYKIPSDTFLSSIIKGGGIVSMLGAMYITFVSCALAGVLEGTNLLSNVHKLLKGVDSRYKLFIYTCICSIITAAFGANQSIAIVLTIQLMSEIYKDMNLDKYQFALNIENSAVVISPLIPWNISGLIPAATLSVSSVKYIPYAFYICLVPIVTIMHLKLVNMKKINAG